LSVVFLQCTFLSLQTQEKSDDEAFHFSVTKNKTVIILESPHLR